MRCGFSLVELSIVLVILGLLTGGILAGQSLIRAAELRAVSTEAQRYAAATQSFRDKYFAVPGDFRKATDFWTSVGGDGSNATCQALDAVGTATCNGDGDGSLMWGGTAAQDYEWYRFWQHLANAGLIEGSYIGTAGSGYELGRNVPKSKVGNVMWLARRGPGYAAPNGTTIHPGSTSSFTGDFKRSLLMIQGANVSSAVSGSWGLKPEEAWNIDTKMDDGIPNQGQIWSNKGNGAQTFCTSVAGAAAGADAGATYRLDVAARDCGLYFLGLFPG